MGKIFFTKVYCHTSTKFTLYLLQKIIEINFYDIKFMILYRYIRNLHEKMKNSHLDPCPNDISMSRHKYVSTFLLYDEPRCIRIYQL